MPQVTIVTVCYERWGFLARTRPTWLDLPGPPDVYVATYRTDEVPAGIDDVHLIEVDAEPFHKTRLQNCAAQVVRERESPEYILFIDCDIGVIDGGVFDDALTAGEPPDFVLDSPYALSKELLVRSPEDPEYSDRGKRGTHLVRSETFFEVGGYDQRIRGWSIDDMNLYRRYREASDRVAFYDRRKVFHVEHSDELRGLNNPDGISHSLSLVKSVRITMESDDGHGRAWADEFGYPDYSLKLPAGTPDR